MSFAKKLASFLKNNEKQWMDEDYNTYMTTGGGSGVNEYMSVDMVALEKQIDEFIEGFNKVPNGNES
jgi:hypothetical protein